MGSGNVEGSTVTSLDLVEFDIFRFRNNFLQVSWIPDITLYCMSSTVCTDSRRTKNEKGE